MSADGDPHGVRVARVHDDAAECLSVVESDVRERLAGVGALVEAVAVGGRLAVVGFARGDVEDVRIGRRERDVGDGRWP